MGRRTQSARANVRVVVEGLEGRRLLAADVPLAFEKVAGLGGEIGDVEVVDGLAYLGTANAVTILDVSDPGAIVTRGEIALPAPAQAITVVGRYVYVADGAYGLQIIDAIDPASPRLVGGVVMPKEWANDPGQSVEDVAVAGTYAYMVGVFRGVQVVDISDPANPALLQKAGAAQGQSIAVAGSHLYMTGWDAGDQPMVIMQVLSIADPARPALAGTYDMAEDRYTLRVTGGYAYAAGWNSGLQIIDVGDPASPVLAGTYSISQGGSGLSVTGGYAYVGVMNRGLQIINISNPASPLLAGEYGQGTPRAVSVYNHHVYLAGYDGLEVVDVSAPASPTRAGKYEFLSDVGAVSVQGSYVYVGAEDLRIFDMSDPAAPLLVGSYETQHGVSDIVVAGPYAYVAARDQGLLIIDVSDPAAPVLVGSADGYSEGVSLVGRYAYVAGWYSGLRIVDVSNPTSPERVYPSDWADPWGWYRYDGPTVRDVEVQGQYAYVAASKDGLQILDTSSLDDIRVVGQYGWGKDNPYGNEADSVAVAGPYAYVTAGNEGLLVFDVSNPTQPMLVRTLGRGTVPSSIAIEGQYAYVTGGGTGLQVMDTGDPTSLVRVPLYDHGGGSRGVAVSGGYLYLANGFGGLHVLRSCPTAFTGTSGDDSYVLRMASDGVTVEVFANTSTSGAPSYRIGRSALDGLRFDTGAGNDTVTNLTDVPCTILGGAGDDSLSGGNGADSIDGGEGSDAIRGGAGNDSILAAAGMDTVVSGAGADRVAVGTDASFTPDADDVLTPATPFQLGGGKTLRFTDADGDRVTVKLSGHGTGEIHLAAGGDIEAITLAGTDATSVLTISVSGPHKGTTIGQINLGTGQLKRLAASRVDLIGAGITSTGGAIGTIQIQDLQNGADIQLPGTALIASGTSLSARTVGGASRIAFGARLNTVSMDSMEDGEFAAPSIRKLRVGRATFSPYLTLTDPGTAGGYTLGSASIGGYVDGTWNIAGRTGTLVVQDTGSLWRAEFGGVVDRIQVRGSLYGEINAPAIGVVSVGRDLGAYLDVRGGATAGPWGLKSIAVGGTMQHGTVRVDGNIGSVTAGAMERSSIYAGYAGSDVPTDADAFGSVRYIKSIQVKGIKGQTTAFSDSRIAAMQIGSVSLAYPDQANPSHIATSILGTFSVKRLVNGKMRTVVTKQPGADMEDSGVSVDLLTSPGGSVVVTV